MINKYINGGFSGRNDLIWCLQNPETREFNPSKWQLERESNLCRFLYFLEGMDIVIPLRYGLIFENDDFIWKFKIDLNLLFDDSKIFKFKFELNSIIIFKIVKVENLRITTQTLSFSNISFLN